MPTRHPSVLKGFTLIELLIVLVVGAILVTIALPSYQASVMKSRRVDARVALNDAAQRLERCYTQFGAYNGADCALSDGEVLASPEGFYTLEVEVPDGVSYTLSAVPQGGQAGDEACGSFGLTHTGVRSITGNGNLGSCW